ncbi:MAG: RNA polymerase sigma factor [Chloroflexi bacterium]|nr:RNA polymerase sigma factor [Chloroflexota bacterium]
MTARRIHEFELPNSGPFADTDERELARAFQRGDDGAYQEIYDRYSPRVHGVCRRMLGNLQDAQEAQQEAFLKVYQGLARFNGRYQLGAWITRVATNVCLDHLRARARKPVEAQLLELTDVDLERVEDADPAVLFLRNAESRRVRRVLSKLPPMHRAAIVLRDFEGLSYPEVAAALEITEGQVKALLHRARQRFKRSWTSAFAPLLWPGRMFEKAKRVDAPVREEAAQAVTGATRAAEALTSGAQVVSSCTITLQHCGQYVAERVAPVFAATVVGTATVGAALAGSVSPPAAAGSVTVPSPADIKSLLSGDAGATDAAHATETSETPEVEPSEEVEADPAVVPVASPSPTESPVAEAPPTPSPTPSPEPAPSTPDPTPAEPPPPAEPQGLNLWFAIDRASSGKPCSCLRSTSDDAQSADVTESGMHGFSQSASGSASAAGELSYGLQLTHSGNAQGHEVSVWLYTDDGAYELKGTGGLTNSMQTDWGGWSNTYSGSYELVSGPKADGSMPTSGTYTVTVVGSWRQDRIVSLDYDLSESRG